MEGISQTNGICVTVCEILVDFRHSSTHSYVQFLYLESREKLAAGGAHRLIAFAYLVHCAAASA